MFFPSTIEFCRKICRTKLVMNMSIRADRKSNKEVSRFEKANILSSAKVEKSLRKKLKFQNLD